MVESNSEGILVSIYTVERTLSTEQDFNLNYLALSIERRNIQRPLVPNPVFPWLSYPGVAPEADLGNTRLY